MHSAREDPDLRHLKHTPAGAEYVRQMTADESDQRTRANFRQLVLRIAPRGGRLFDFGAGPGIDARYFAQQGFTVDAYDVDPRMREFFNAHCRDLIDSGLVSLEEGTYPDFLAGGSTAGGARADLVISNFAPLNLVDDLGPLFARFHSLTTAQGKVLACVLNPLYIGEMRSRWWWRRAPRLLSVGELFLPGPQAPHYRRLLRHFGRMSTPYFKLSQVFPGQEPLARDPHGFDLQQGGQFTWLHLVRHRFMFVLFDKASSP
jgi:SAM-dependent methyltransferase